MCVSREFSYESPGERILKIGSYLPKLLSRGILFWDTLYTSLFIIIMTSRKKVSFSTFGHVSFPHGRDASARARIFAQIALSNSELLTFSEIQDGDRRHLGFSVYVNLAIPAC